MDDNRCSNSFSFITAKSSSIPRDNNDEDEEEATDPYGGLFDDDDEETKILRIKDELEDPHQVILQFLLNFSVEQLKMTSKCMLKLKKCISNIKKNSFFSQGHFLEYLLGNSIRRHCYTKIRVGLINQSKFKTAKPKQPLTKSRRRHRNNHGFTGTKISIRIKQLFRSTVIILFSNL